MRSDVQDLIDHHVRNPYGHIAKAWQRAMDLLQPTPAQLEHGLALHLDSVAIDTFGFLPMVWTQETVRKAKQWQDEGIGAKAYFEKFTYIRLHDCVHEEAATKEFLSALRSSGLNGMVLTAGGGEALENCLRQMACYTHVCQSLHRHMSQVTTAEEFREARRAGRFGVIWSVNGPPPMGDLADPDAILDAVETWYHLGVRLMHISYNRRNLMGDGCTEAADGGLSDLGREFVHKLNEVGIIVDTPHSGRQTTLDAAALSRKPMMASHIGAKTLHNHPRCKSDEEIDAIAATGGLMGIYALPNLLGPNATLATVLDHLDYIAGRAGVDHVCIATDSRYNPPWPADLGPYPTKRNMTDRVGAWKPEHKANRSEEHLHGTLAWTNWPLYSVGLVQRGYSDEDIRKILAGNFMRVLEANRPVRRGTE